MRGWDHRRVLSHYWIVACDEGVVVRLVVVRIVVKTVIIKAVVKK